MKDITQQMYKTVNKLIDEIGESNKPVEKTKGLLNRTSRGMPIEKTADEDSPLYKVVEYVKRFRKLRKELK